MATTNYNSINGGDIRDLMLESIERRFGLVTRLPMPIEWLSDNGSPYTARETRAFADKIGLLPRTTPIESPQSNGMAEAFVEHVFAVQKRRLGLLIRTVGMVRPRAKIGLANLAFNFTRLAWLNGRTVPV